MKSFFNEEIEAYTRPSSVKMWMLAGVVFAGAVAFGWLLTVAPKIVLFMDVYVDSL